MDEEKQRRKERVNSLMRGVKREEGWESWRGWEEEKNPGNAECRGWEREESGNQKREKGSEK